MGCDIHSFAEVKRKGKWERVEEAVFPDGNHHKTTEPFGWRSYSLFGFLADVRNYSHCAPISETKGLPDDSEYLNEIVEDDFWGGVVPGQSRKKELIQDCNYHSHSYLTLKELVDFDYNKVFWNRRVTKQTGKNSWTGAGLAEDGEGTTETYREFLGEHFFNDIEVLKTLGNPEDVRVIFYFDS